MKTLTLTAAVLLMNTGYAFAGAGARFPRKRRVVRLLADRVQCWTRAMRSGLVKGGWEQ